MGLTKPRAAQIYNLDYKQATRAVTVANITLAGGAPSVVDGVSLSLNDRVLVTAQSTGSQNGLYLVTTVGSGSNGTWARTTDANQTGEIDAGMIVMVTEGTMYADTQWKLITDNPITIDTTALTFTQNYSANSITGGTSNVTVYSNANVTISSAGTANVLTVTSTGTVTSGTVSVTGNITGGNVSGTNLTGTTVSVTGNVNGGNISTVGLITATGNVYTGNILAGGYYYANGAVFGGGGSGGTPGGSNTYVQFNDNGVFNGTAGLTFVKTTNALSTTGAISTTGTITAASTVGGVITGSSSSVSGTVTAASTVGGVITGSSTSVTGTVTAASIVGGVSTATSYSTAGNITGGNITIAGSANISTFIGNTFFGTVPAQPTYYNIAPLNLNNSLAAATKVQLNLINTGGGAGAGSAIDFYTYQISVAAANAESRIAAIDDGNYSAYLSLQTKTPGSTGTNTLVERVKIDSTGVSVVANITGGNISATNHTGTNVSVTGTVTAASTIGGVITGSSSSVTGAVTGASVVGGVMTGSSVSVTGTVTGGNITTAGQLTVNSGANVTAIVNGATTGVGNIGSSTVGFNTVFAKATTAQYADLAEIYVADNVYTPGTVVEFGGNNEITITTSTHSVQAAGIISTQPAYLMNSTQAGEHTLEVALVGRVPCSVVGTIRKGDRLVSSNIPGVAQALNINLYQPGCIIGKALEDYNSAEPGIIEVAVGRL